MPFGDVLKNENPLPGIQRNPAGDWGRKKSILSIRHRLKQTAVPTMKATIWFPGQG